MIFQKLQQSPLKPNGLITIYVVFYVLKRMIEHLGIEAALEYAKKYIEKLEDENPKIREYADRTMSDVDIVKMYKDVML